MEEELEFWAVYRLSRGFKAAFGWRGTQSLGTAMVGSSSAGQLETFLQLGETWL